MGTTIGRETTYKSKRIVETINLNPFPLHLNKRKCRSPPKDYNVYPKKNVATINRNEIQSEYTSPFKTKEPDLNGKKRYEFPVCYFSRKVARTRRTIV